MKKLFFPLFIFITLSAFSQPGMKTKDIFNKELTYNFGSLIIDITFSSDSTLSWKEGTTDQITHEKCSSFMIDDHTMMTRWYGTENFWVILTSDFTTGKTSITRGTEKMLNGIISLKK